MKTFLNLLSWIGILVILAAYVTNVFGVIETESLAYLLMNIVGSVFIIFHAFQRRDYQPAVLNIIWALVALINLARVL